MNLVEEIRQLLTKSGALGDLIDVVLSEEHAKTVTIHEQVRRLMESNEKWTSFHLGEINDDGYEFKILLPFCPQLLISVFRVISTVEMYVQLVIRLPGDKYVGRKYFNLPDDGLDDDSDEDGDVFYIYSVDEFVPILNKLNRNFGGPAGQ